MNRLKETRRARYYSFLFVLSMLAVHLPPVAAKDRVRVEGRTVAENIVGLVCPGIVVARGQAGAGALLPGISGHSRPAWSGV